MLEKTEQFLINNHKRPVIASANIEEKKLGTWISNQLQSYKNTKNLMKTDDIRNKWIEFTEKYIDYFRTNEDEWNILLTKTEQYIQNNCKRPSQHSKNNDEKIIGMWMTRQQPNYIKKQQIMKNPEIYNRWTEFIMKYPKYFSIVDEINDSPEILKNKQSSKKILVKGKKPKVPKKLSSDSGSDTSV